LVDPVSFLYGAGIDSPQEQWYVSRLIVAYTGLSKLTQLAFEQAWVLLTFITILSLSPLRNRHYEFFYWSHVVLLLLFFAAAIMHHQVRTIFEV